MAVRAHRHCEARAMPSSTNGSQMLTARYSTALCMSTRLVYSSLNIMSCTTTKPPVQRMSHRSRLRSAPSARFISLRRCAGVQKVSRPMVSCQEMSQYRPDIIQAAASTLAHIYQGIGLLDGDGSTAKVLIVRMLSWEK